MSGNSRSEVQGGRSTFLKGIPEMAGSAWHGSPGGRAAALYLGASVTIFFGILLPSIIYAQAPPAYTTEPKLLSIFPSAARPASTLQVDVRGNFLLDAYAAWFDSNALSARLIKVEKVDEPARPNPLEKKPDKPPTIYRARIELHTSAAIREGTYALRLLTARGISDAVTFRVVDEPVTVESGGAHGAVQRAQAISYPTIILGKLENPGELDYYSFHARRGQELRFEAVASQNCQPQLELYRAGGSWFNEARPTHLLSEEERTSNLIPIRSRATHRFAQGGD